MATGWHDVTLNERVDGTLEVSFESAGCGCCSGGQTLKGEKAVVELEEYIKDLQSEIEMACNMIKRLLSATKTDNL